MVVHLVRPRFTIHFALTTPTIPMRSQNFQWAKRLLPFALSTLAGQANLIAYWPFDDGEGTVVTDVIGGFNGTISGGGVWTEEAQVGTGAFSGTANEQVVCDPAAISTTSDLTLSWWMIDNQTSWGTVIDKSTTDASSGFVILVRPTTTEDSPLRFRLGGWQNYGTWPGECRVPSDAYADGEWVHVTCVYDSLIDTASIYINGQLAENGALNPRTNISSFCDGPNNPTAPLYLRGGFESFNGVLDDVAMWDRPLTPEEVVTAYESGPLSVEQDEIDPSVTAISYDSENNDLTLTWDSAEGDTFIVQYSTDLITWDFELEDGVPAVMGEQTTRTFSLDGLSLPDTVYFRVLKE